MSRRDLACGKVKPLSGTETLPPGAGSGGIDFWTYLRRSFIDLRPPLFHSFFSLGPDTFHTEGRGSDQELGSELETLAPAMGLRFYLLRLYLCTT